MKEDWKECKLGEVLTIKYGKNQKEVESPNGTIPIYGTGGLMGYATKFLYDKPSILIGRKGTINKVKFIDKPFWTVDTLFYSIINEEIVSPKFLYYQLSLINFMNYNEGTTIPSLRTETLNRIEVSLPPLATQQKIATILSSLDDKIELNNKINDNLEQQAQAIYDELFNNDDRTIILGDIIETTSGGTPSRKNMAFYTNGNYCWVKSKELQSSFIIDTEEKITDDAINNSAAKLLPKNSVLIAMYGATVGAYGIISKDMTCNQAICALLPNENYPYSYLFMFAKNITYELENLAVGSAQQNISQVLIKKLKVHSDTNKIKEFHSYTHSLFEKKLLIEQENKNLSNLRDTLLPKLMCGET